MDGAGYAVGASDSLIQKFLSTAGERLTEFGQLLSTLRHTDDVDGVVKRLARDLHTYKGESRLLGLDEIERITHAAEGVLFSHHRAGQLDNDSEQLLFESIDQIFVCVQARLEDQSPPLADVEALVQRLRAAAERPAAAETPSEPRRAPEPSSGAGPEKRARGTLQLDLERLDTITDLVSNVSGAIARNRKLLNALNETMRELRECLAEADDALAREEAIAPREGVDSVVLDRVQRLTDVLREFREHHVGLELDFGELSDAVRASRLQPLRTIFVSYAPFARTVARREGKEIEVALEGDDLGVDQQVLDRIAEPCLHLLRNAIVHGIEPIEDRLAAGKPAAGRIWITARQDGDSIHLEFSDDGRGIDLDHVRRRALALGLIDEAEAERFTLADASGLIFESGLSTAATADELAGRGVGLDVVREVVDAMGGTLEVQSVRGRGSRFTLSIPASLSSSHVLLFETSDQVLAVPTAAVVEMLRLSAKDIRRVEGREATEWRGERLPLIRLREALGLPGIRDIFVNRVGVIILRSGNERAGFIVDDFVGEREVVVRPYGAFLGRPELSDGVTLLEDGSVVLILNPADLLRHGSVSPARKGPRPVGRAGSELRILYAEDSLITRDYTAGVLRSRGYEVTEASHGEEAWALLQSRPFDLLLADIQMPRLNGFELCARIRASAPHKDLPIVVMSTLEAPEAKKLAMDAGADAYLVKSAFAADVLVGTIERVVR